MYIHIKVHKHIVNIVCLRAPAKQEKNKENEKSYQVGNTYNLTNLQNQGVGESKERRTKLSEKCLSFH